MQRKLLTVVITVCTAADLAVGPPGCSVEPEAETSTHTPAKYDRCSKWRHVRAPRQSTARHEGTELQAEDHPGYLNVSSTSAIRQPHWGPAHTHLLGVLQLCRVTDMEQRYQGPPIFCFLKNEGSAKEAAKCCCSWRAGQLQDTTLQATEMYCGARA